MQKYISATRFYILQFILRVRFNFNVFNYEVGRLSYEGIILNNLNLILFLPHRVPGDFEGSQVIADVLVVDAS